MTRRKSYRQQVLAIDPGAVLVGPFYHGHYVSYHVTDSAGVTIGWTEGNERGAALAWLRALSALQKRAQKVTT